MLPLLTSLLQKRTEESRDSIQHLVKSLYREGKVEDLKGFIGNPKFREIVLQTSEMDEELVKIVSRWYVSSLHQI